MKKYNELFLASFDVLERLVFLEIGDFLKVEIIGSLVNDSISDDDA